MTSRPTVEFWRAALMAGALLIGDVDAARASKHEAPIPFATLALMALRDTSPSAPMLIRTFKKESELEVWKLSRSGRYVLLKTFPVCRWSGQLGPKRKTGDRQTPEGFYAVGERQLNPNSAYYLSFNIGYPNAYDRAHGGTGSHLMVHGTCSSMGCFAMTDRQVGEIYALAREAFAGGQAAFQFQAYPFRMSAANMARHRSDRHIEFWRQLKQGSDRFEATGEEPAVGVSGGRYVFAPARDPAKEALAQARLAAEAARVATLVEEGGAAIRTTYSDGGMHPSFAAQMRTGFVGEVSRPEALASAGLEVVVLPARKRPATLLAAAVLPPPAPERSTPVSVAFAGVASSGASVGAAPAPLTIFAATALGYGAGWRGPAPSTLAGAAPIMAPVLVARPIEVASR